MDYDRFYDGEDQDGYQDGYKDGYEDEYDEQQGTVGYLNSEEIISVINADLAQKEMKIALLEKAIAIASKTWFWRFRDEKYKTNAITNVYFRLQELTNIE